jgi:hypothetical protein
MSLNTMLMQTGTRSRLATGAVCALCLAALLGSHLFAADLFAADSPAAKKGKSAKPNKSDSEPASEKASPGVRLPEVFSTGYTGKGVELIGFINQQVRQVWSENGVTPSEPADDAEFCRRVHLDIVGHIPDVDAVSRFLADKERDKRARLIDELLESPGYVRNFTTIWTNLMIGRLSGPQDRISRKGMQKFLRESFRKNRPWSEMVYDLVSAEGHFEENGATNFLLAHLNDGAVPATAITAKLFLGIQVQCTQCHNHPFNDWKQNQFWEFNSYFKQADKREVEEYDPRTGREEFKYAELVNKEFSGPVFWETRAAEMKVSYPKFNGVEIPDGSSTNRRLELARLMVSGEKPQIADAMVNRMWGHFFGFGFTRPVDDMGPHKTPSHPELLDRLAVEFVKSNYDLKHLIRLICNSEAYNLTSRFNARNLSDNPAAGEIPLFSHMYMKSLTVEQLYDSLIIATNAHKSGRGNWEQAEAQRQAWLQQFVVAFGTDENDESTSFEGTIPQALMMMNGDLVGDALKGGKGTLLGDVFAVSKNPDQAVRLLYLATLSRNPKPRELQTIRSYSRYYPNTNEWLQDTYWALLNSNEFIFNH